MKTLDDTLKRSNNNYDLVRLVAALMVVFGHSFELFNPQGQIDPVRYWLKTEYSGSIAVYIFFFLSGIFITASFDNKKSHLSFVIARIFRIWPGLIVCVLLTVLLVGPMVTTYPLADYFKFHATRSYPVRNILMYNIQYYLPGVFEKNHYPTAVNGSLWTLPLEVKCYIGVFLVGIAGAFKSKYVAIGIYILLLAACATNYKAFANYVNRPVPFFILGSLFYMLRRYIVIDYRILLVLLVVFLVFRNVILFYPLLVYGVMVIGSSSTAIKIKLPGDYSYGIYIYGFLVQQLLAFYIFDITAYGSMLLSFPLVILAAAFSWHAIEFPFINFSKRIASRVAQFHYI